MGWLYTQKDPDESVKDYFARELVGPSSELLDCAVVNFRTAYLAIKRDDRVFAAVCLLDYRPRDLCNFGFKSMDENMGPYKTDCPERILKLLTPTDHKDANEWREKCRKKLERRKKFKLRKGLILNFAEGQEVNLSNGDTPRWLLCLDARRLRFRTDCGIVCRLDRPFLVNAFNAGRFTLDKPRKTNSDDREVA